MKPAPAWNHVWIAMTWALLTRSALDPAAMTAVMEEIKP
jgi:hypothetical protein